MSGDAPSRHGVPGPWVDSVLARLSARSAGREGPALPTRRVDTPVGPVRVFDTGTAGPCVVFVPDGPNVIEHYEPLIALLAARLRVVCFDMPGFGHSLPQPSYAHSLDQGAGAVLGVMDALDIQNATLAFSCANGFYALRAAQAAPQRITRLLLSQTPSLAAMHAWTDRIVPRPLRVPVLGQLLGWVFRRQAAHSWYRRALPRATAREPYQEKALQSLARGGCFCLAGVVQGLSREAVSALRGVNTPCTMVWGALDHSHQPTDPRSLLDCVPQAEIVVFSDCGHFPDIEQAERYAALLMDKMAPPA